MNWRTFSKLVMVEQTLFALPWVLTAALLPFCSASFAAHFQWDQWTRWLCILVGFMSARTAGMAFNRIIDRNIDAANPRTRARTLPAGEATVWQVSIIAWVNILAFVLCCGMLNSLCLGLSPLVVALLWVYSYTKRYTSLCHIVLGVIQFFGPFFAWAAITDSWGLAPILLGSAVLCSIAGMDIVYALQDRDFDTKHGLHSLPVALGAVNSLWVARGLHILAVMLLLEVGISLDANACFLLGVLAVASVYIYFHSKINIDDLRRINEDFFSCNAIVGMTLFTFTVGSLVWRALL